MNPDPFLDSARGLIHVGAHHGEERFLYAQKRLRVLWIEADPAQMSILRANLRGFPRQTCVQALLGSRVEPACEFFLANNAGASSSVYPLSEAHLIWPDVKIIQSITLPKLTLPEALNKAGHSLKDFDTLIMDVQGSEMEILRGIPFLEKKFMRIQLETSDFPVYQGAPLKSEIDQYLIELGYQSAGSDVFASAGGRKNCMDCRYILKGKNHQG